MSGYFRLRIPMPITGNTVGAVQKPRTPNMGIIREQVLAAINRNTPIIIESLTYLVDTPFLPYTKTVYPTWVHSVNTDLGVVSLYFFSEYTVNGECYVLNFYQDDTADVTSFLVREEQT